MNWSGLSDANSNLRLHVVLLGLAAINAYVGMPFLSVPLVAWVAARWIVLGLSALKHRAHVRAVGEWNGRYYAFDDRQVRVYWDAAQGWIHAGDLLKTVGRQLEGSALQRIRLRLGEADFRVPEGLDEPCFSETGAVNYLRGVSGDRAWQVRNWLERAVLPNLASLREKQSATYRRYQLPEDEGVAQGEP